MDLMPANKGVDGFHANWSSWSMIQDLLTEAGQDLSELSGSNDGLPVSAATATSWGEAIERVKDRIIILAYPDKDFVGGERYDLRVEGSETPVIVSARDAANAAIAELFSKPGMEEFAAARGTQEVTDTPPRTMRLSESPETEEFILAFAAFCRASGGFEQW